MKKIIYLDNAATTLVRKEVFEAMKKYFMASFGNPGSITKIGVLAKKAVEDSRLTIAQVLDRRPKEIIFTSSGTESNNLAIMGTVNYLSKAGVKISDMHFLTTNIEHSSVSVCFKEIESCGGQVEYLSVNSEGLIDLRDLRKKIRNNTVLVSIAYANNEIGVIQPIKEIAKEVRHARQSNTMLVDTENDSIKYPYFHTDASQAVQYLNVNINQLGVDFMTIDAQKIYGPKGVGALFIKSGIQVSPIIFGGGQERGFRSSTENVPGIVGMGKALELVEKNKKKENVRLQKFQKYFIQKINKKITEAFLNGGLDNRLPNNINISIPGIDSEFVVLCLDEKGIVCSTKSACAKDENGSVVIGALGLGNERAISSLRFSLGIDTQKADLDRVVSELRNILDKINRSKI